MSLFTRLLTLLSMMTVAACGAQVDASYPGEALATISGNVTTSSAPVPTTSIDAAIVWARVKFEADESLIQSVQWVGESTPVSGQFPAAFQINVYEPPPASALIACTNSSAHIAAGFIVAVNGTADLNADPKKAVVGSAGEYLLLYLDADQPNDWECLPGLGFTFAPTKGFHLLLEVPNSVTARYAGVKYPAYAEALQGLATDVTVTLGSSSFGPSTTEECEISCESRASTCGAPTSESTPACVSFCESKPSDSQLSCIQTSSCADLENAYKSGLGLCAETMVVASPTSGSSNASASSSGTATPSSPTQGAPASGK